MPAVRFPIRPWLYLAAAAVLLAVPLMRYTDTPEQLAFVAFGTLIVTLAAHVEVLNAVRCSKLPQMRGQPDMLRLSMFRIGLAEWDVWRRLWHSGRWTVVAALILSRFALALALTHYLYLFFVDVRDVPVLGDGINSLLRTVNYISHNEWNYPPFRPDFAFVDAAAWQKALALMTIAALSLAETRFVMMLGLLLCTGPRWLQRHLAGAAGLVRIAAVGIGSIVALQIALAPWLPAPPYYSPYTSCVDAGTVADEIYKQYYAWHGQPCRGIVLGKYVAAAGEAAILLVGVPFEGGILSATNIMRPTVGVAAAAERELLRTRHEFTYFTRYRPGLPATPTSRTAYGSSPLWLVVRMVLTVFSAISAYMMVVVVLRHVVSKRLYSG